MDRVPGLPGKSDRKQCIAIARSSVIAKGGGEYKSPRSSEKKPVLITMKDCMQTPATWMRSCDRSEKKRI
jgi:hypothetical protein